VPLAFYQYQPTGGNVMRIAYPAFIKKAADDFLVYIPDFDGMTQGESFADAIDMARDYIGLACLDYEDQGKSFPDMSDAQEAEDIARNRADDETIKFSDGQLTYVDLDYTRYRAKVRNQSVKKNCTLPLWLCEEAEEKGINFSRVLQEALEEKISAVH